MKTIKTSATDAISRLLGEVAVLRRDWREANGTLGLRFDEVGRKLDRISRRLDGLEAQLDQLHTR